MVVFVIQMSLSLFSKQLLQNTASLSRAFESRMDAFMRSKNDPISASLLLEVWQDLIESVATGLKLPDDTPFPDELFSWTQKLGSKTSVKTPTIHQLRDEFSVLHNILIDDHQTDHTLPTITRLSLLLSQALSHATEELLRRSQNRSTMERNWFEQVMNKLPKPLFLFDLDKQALSFSNIAAKELLGIEYSTENRDKIYKSAVEVFDLQGNILAFESIPSSRVMRGEEIKGEELILKTPTGEFHIKVFSERLLGLSGLPNSALILLQDITALKKIEQSLLKKEIELSRAIETAEVGFWHLDLKTQKTYLTPLLLQQFGLHATEQDVELEVALNAIHFKDRERVKRAITESIENKTPYHIEYRVVHSSKDIRWIEARGALNHDLHNGETLFTGTSVDITDRVLASERIRARERELQILADCMPQIVWGALPSGSLNYFNKVWFDYSGSSLEENLNDGWMQFVHSEDLLSTTQRWSESLASGRPYENEFRLKNKNGVYRWHIARATPIIDEHGQVKKWYGTNTDVDDQKRTAVELSNATLTAEAANTAKSRFLANMSHEIRTPLGAITGFASLLSDDSISKKEHEHFISVIQRNSNQLLRIIDDILDLSKVEAGMIIIENIEFSLQELLGDISSLMGLKAREKGLLFSLIAVTPIPKVVHSDPTRLRQILINIIGNAIKFTDNGSVEIRIRQMGNDLIFEVQDTGRGISSDQAEYLFQPFMQADSSTTRIYGGTGLGLALTRSLANAMGGSFVLKHSELGKGSTFEVCISMANTQPISFPVESRTGKSQKQSVDNELEGTNILLVEDSPDNQILLSFLLNRSGAKIKIASDGAQGYQFAINGKFDIVLMDIQMPIMDGLTTVKKLRNENYSTPIIALTAHAMKEERERCLSAGFTDFLSKPVGQVDLIQMIKKYIYSK
jgi:two-component system, sensor histidine kinase